MPSALPGACGTCPPPQHKPWALYSRLSPTGNCHEFPSCHLYGSDHQCYLFPEAHTLDVSTYESNPTMPADLDPNHQGSQDTQTTGMSQWKLPGSWWTSPSFTDEENKVGRRTVALSVQTDHLFLQTWFLFLLATEFNVQLGRTRRMSYPCLLPPLDTHPLTTQTVRAAITGGSRGDDSTGQRDLARPLHASTCSSSILLAGVQGCNHLSKGHP